MERAINKKNILKVLLCEEWFFDELSPRARFIYRVWAIPGCALVIGSFYYFHLMDNHTLLTVSISVFVTMTILAIQYYSRWQDDTENRVEKTDEGFTWFYINLSYRRRFRRTIYMIVFLTAVMTFLFVKNEGEYGFYISRGLIVVTYIFAMAQSVGGLLYNRRKWKAAETS